MGEREEETAGETGRDAMNFDWWDAALIGGAAYLAVALLVRFMLVRRSEIIAELGRQIEQQRANRRSARSAETAGQSQEKRGHSASPPTNEAA